MFFVFSPYYIRFQPFVYIRGSVQETIVWLTEAPDSMKVGINLKDNSDSEWLRACTKLATGTGKTVIMAMIIAWQALNKITNPKDARFSKNILVMAPGITVKERLAVLIPSSAGNYYDEFNIVPSSLKEYIYQSKVVGRYPKIQTLFLRV